VQGLRAAVAAALVLVLVWLVAGSWDSSRALQLVRVSEVTPRDVESGERISIAGDGFPSGKPARVSFRGVLYRPGLEPQRGAEITVWGTVTAPDRVEIVFDAAAEVAFCGPTSRAEHTTFEGEVEVAFASALPGSPPIAGALGGVSIDVQPSRDSDPEGRRKDADRLLEYVGMHASAQRAGLFVDAVDPGSQAQAAGLAAGDVIEAFDGVDVRSLSDAAPTPGEPEARLRVARGSQPPFTKTLSVAGFGPEVPARWTTSVLIVFTALAFVVFCAAPPPFFLSIWIQSALVRVRERFSARASARAIVAAALRDVARDLTPSGGGAIAGAAALALLLVLPFGPFRIAHVFDAGEIFIGASVALAAATLVSGRSIAGGIRRAALVLVEQVPAAVGFACGLMSTGSLGIEEIAGAQGPWPWQWLVFRSPSSLLAFFLLLSSARIDPCVEASPTARAFVRAILTGHRVVFAGLASLLFLGAWSLPGCTATEAASHPVWLVAGAGIFVAKTAAVLAALATARWLVPPARAAARVRSVAFRWTPLSLATAGLTSLGSVMSVPPAWQPLVSGMLMIGVVFAATSLVAAAWSSFSRPVSEAWLNAFL
jgi:hypothetical protein